MISTTNIEICQFVFKYVLSTDTPSKPKMAMENQHLKMRFLLNMGIVQCHISFQGVIIQESNSILVSKWDGSDHRMENVDLCPLAYH